MKTLCLFTNEFPYGNWEPYLETEVKYYRCFDKVYIFALQLRKDHAKTIRTVPDNIKVIPIAYAPKWKYLLNAFRVLFNSHLYQEIKQLLQQKRLNFARLINLFVFLSRADYEARQISKHITKEAIYNAIFYSYRFEYQPYVAILLNQKYGLNNKIICRTHGFDLYEERRPSTYIPCRQILLQNVDYVYPCSQDGEHYLQEKFPFFKEKVHASFLGTEDYGIGLEPNRQAFSIVSCSNLVPVKRIDLLIEALKLITNKPIRWVHFGDGPLLSSIQQSIKNLPENIQVELKGHIKNSELMKIYRQHAFDVFVNVSNSEGIPVSIMEANSFGIPAIATNVGGTAELVKTGTNGILIDANATPQNIAQEILRILALPASDYTSLRKSTRAHWLKHFSAEVNYQKFVKAIQS
ncbi:glycosyltransferase [Gallibacterium anatis]|uniref:Glycosyl transferase family 1 domain-containing protein n=1 Tax=Gallibacterium anatis TaxID=750 RepID=A0A1A7NSZ7_9PAST|nr:glycosyltransferase [Gallibacterium anatis]KGQ39362.1 hypothetical protein JP35_05315 [Gallibacterium anatis]OBW92124.1 hypothetical protein QV02_10720 [Gallibacterium anatis]OBW99773.1 hypothetical protein QV03_02590 [Gallibacterium anatis]